jgi:ribonuclease P protein component
MSAQTGRFRRTDRLRRSIEFERVTRRGRRARGAAFVVLVAPRVGSSADVQATRLGVTVSRKVGDAVVRNLVKRRIREWFRVQRESGIGFDRW